jgi:hypothetical protein
MQLANSPAHTSPDTEKIQKRQTQLYIGAGILFLLRPSRGKSFHLLGLTVTCKLSLSAISFSLICNTLTHPPFKGDFRLFE